MSAGADIGIVVTFHREGRLAHRVLGALLSDAGEAMRAGYSVRATLVLDRADAETRLATAGRDGLPAWVDVIEVDAGDVSGARNRGIQATPARYIAVCDGDDFFSPGWFAAAARRADAFGNPCVVHPAQVVAFGREQLYWRQPDQTIDAWDPISLLFNNLWVSAVMAPRAVFLDVPYLSREGGAAGFAYEDWHWQCEIAARGIPHLVAPRTTYFERKKHSGSVNLDHRAALTTFGPTRLFRPWAP